MHGLHLFLENARNSVKRAKMTILCIFFKFIFSHSWLYFYSSKCFLFFIFSAEPWIFSPRIFSSQ
jgi:hypothetical protein